ncbi:MAG: hypothetical protein U0U67_06835 [Chitinophagales bacterium]
MIDKIKEKPFLLLLIPAILFFALSLIPTNETTDIQLHDLFIVIAQQQIYIGITFIFFILFGLYMLFQNKLWSKKLTWIHIILTTVLFLYIFYIASILFPFSPESPRKYYSYNEFENYAIINKVISICTIILCFFQFLFLANITIGVIKKSNPSK